MLAQGDSMAVTGQILHYGVDLLEPGLAVDHPVLLHQGLEHALEGLGVLESWQFSVLVTLAQAAHEVSTEVA